ncbi:hypothetical protein ACFL9T_05200 [Thermodesulfobacteriota bacterium]
MKQWSMFLWLSRLINWGWRKLRGARRVEITGRFNGAVYYLNSPVLEDTEYECKEAQEFNRAVRDKFESGKLFLPLKAIPDSGGFVFALITEHGKVSQDHILAIYPTYMEKSKCREEDLY